MDPLSKVVALTKAKLDREEAEKKRKEAEALAEKRRKEEEFQRL